VWVILAIVGAIVASKASGQPARRFKEFSWSTRDSWSRQRRVIAKARARSAFARLCGHCRDHRPRHLEFGDGAMSAVFDSFTLDGAIDCDTSKGDRLVTQPDARQVRSADHPLYGGIQDYP
jgi:hypothetical protein